MWLGSYQGTCHEDSPCRVAGRLIESRRISLDTRAGPHPFTPAAGSFDLAFPSLLAPASTMTIFRFTALLGKISASLAAGFVLLASGCSSTRARPEWMQTIAFWDKKEVDKAYQGQIPAKRIEVLRETAKTMSTRSQAEQQAKADEWAKAYRDEADPLIRAEFLKAIASCGSPIAGETLARGLQDPDKSVRIAGCEAWAKHGGPAAISQLSEATRKDANIDVRLAAVRSLGVVGPQYKDAAIAALAGSLDDNDPAIQYRTIQSMRRISGKDFGDDVSAWREFAKGGSPAEISVVQRAKLDVF